MLQPYTALNSTLHHNSHECSYPCALVKPSTHIYKRKGYYPQAKTSFLRLDNFRSSQNIQPTVEITSAPLNNKFLQNLVKHLSLPSLSVRHQAATNEK